MRRNQWPGEPQSKISNWSDNIKQLVLPPELEYFKRHFSGRAMQKTAKGQEKLKFETDYINGELRGRFEWGEHRDKLFDRFYEAQETLNEGYVSEAEAMLKKIIKKDAQFIDAYNTLGFLEMFYKSYEKSLRIFRQAYKIGDKLIPQDFSGKITWSALENRPFLRAMQGLGVTYLETGKFRKADGIFAKMLHYNPNDNQGIRALAIQCNLALKNYSRVLSICHDYPDDTMADTLYGWVLALYSVDKKNEAEEKLNRAIEILPLVAEELTREIHVPV